MRVLSDVDSSSVNGVTSKQLPVKVCMHVLGSARTDMRVMREATALVEGGFEVYVVDIECERTLPVEEEIRGVHVKHIIMPSWLTPTHFKPWFLVKLAQVFVHGTFRMMRITADVYHAHDETALPACYVAARLQRKPLIFDAHEFPLSEQSVSRWRRLHKIAENFLTYMIRYCAGVITISPPIVQEIRRRYRAKEVLLIRNVPPYRVVPKSDRLRWYLGFSPDTRIALYQGGLSSDRELDRLVRAARFLDQGIVIVMMGKSIGTAQSELEALIATENVSDRVKIIPAVPYEELLDWTASADVGLIIYSPDYSLNVRMCLPNKFFEYLMAGLPILSSQLEVVADTIRTYDVGQVVTSLAPSDIAAGINKVLADSAALSHMRRNALESVQHDFCWEKECEQLIHFYHEILT